MTKKNLTPKLIIAPDAQQLAEAGADLFERTVADAVQHRGRAAAALSGGSTPGAMNRLLAAPPYLDRIPWKYLHLFWVDDRMVPVDDPASNFGAAKDDFISRVPIPSQQVHPMPVLDPPSRGVEHYTRELKRYFGSDAPVFDLILLGVGTDGHTASLFPDQADAHKGPQWVLGARGGNPNVYRLTLNYPILNRARTIAFVVSGRDKAGIVRTLLCDDEVRYPPQRIRPESGLLLWLLDQPAASRLQEGMCSMG
jgi:6-phosphogluconolactonase